MITWLYLINLVSYFLTPDLLSGSV